MSNYSLGSQDPEMMRLEAQAAFLDAPTRLLLAAAGIKRGARVLDLGSGLGHVTRAVAELVGPGGAVVGLDQDPRMIEAARQRTEANDPVTFVQGDALTWRDDAPFDAVVGRLILFHLPDPVAVVHHHAASVRPGGRVVFLDYDIGGLRAEPPEPLTARMRGLVCDAFRAVGADPTIGSRLGEILRQAQVHDVAGFGLASYLQHDDPAGPGMLVGVVRSLAPVILGHGLATEDELDLDTLGERAAAALAERASVLVPPLLAGAWGAAPG